jgi:Capsule assembly protein Wzi
MVTAVFWDSGGKDSKILLQATEGTPLLPNNDGIATGAGSNEVLRWSGWAGFGGFLTGYGELEASGPLTRSLSDKSRVLPLNAEAVASIGNLSLSIGQEEMWWGIGHFAALSQSNNTSPFPAVRAQNIHPKLLPGFLRYLGQFRYIKFSSVNWTAIVTMHTRGSPGRSSASSHFRILNSVSPTLSTSVAASMTTTVFWVSLKRPSAQRAAFSPARPIHGPALFSNFTSRAYGISKSTKRCLAKIIDQGQLVGSSHLRPCHTRAASFCRV